MEDDLTVIQLNILVNYDDHKVVVIKFSDDSIVYMRPDQYEAIHEVGVQFAANLMGKLQQLRK